MCHVWNHPTRTAEEFDPKILQKIPAGMRRLNITGGEPMLRADIRDIVRILDSKTTRLEISTNGYFTDRLVEIAREFPRITVRVSVEGLPEANDRLRGLKNGFDHALRTLLRLKHLGLEDIGFAMTVSGENCRDLLDLYMLAASLDVEFANAVVHNSFYFHKTDNEIADKALYEKAMAEFMTALLSSPRKRLKRRIKDWFRAYLNAGLLHHVRGLERPISCGAGTDTFFVDPWGYLVACNGSESPWVMGDLNTQSFEEIWSSPRAAEVREQVRQCRRNCWMTGTAVPAMRREPWKPALWVARNKWRLWTHRPLCV
jgi:Fe-coproporphyrin III synthase